MGIHRLLKASKKETKRIKAAKDPKLRKLFALISENEELQRFRNTLKYLVNKRYDADICDVKSFFDGVLTKNDLSTFLKKRTH